MDKEDKIHADSDKRVWAETLLTVVGVAIFFIWLAMLLALFMFMVYGISLLVELAIPGSKCLTFTAFLILVMITIRAKFKLATRRRSALEQKIRDDPEVTVEVYEAGTESRIPEDLASIVNFLEPYDYEVQFGLFEDEMEALGLRDKCWELDSETWASKKSVIKPHLSAIWMQQYDSRPMTFMIFASGQGNGFFYRDYLDAAEKLLAMNDSDIVIANLEMPASLEMIYKPGTTFPVNTLIRVIVENLPSNPGRNSPLTPVMKL